MRGGLLRGKPPLLFLRSGILAGQGSFLYAESRNKQNWRDIDMPNTGVRAMRCASCCSTSRTWTGCWARMSAARKRSRSMIASNGHAPKRFGETRSHTFMCVQRVSGALPLTSRGQFSRRRKLPEKQSGYLFALLAKTACMKKSIINCCYLLILCFMEIEKFLLLLC